MMVIVCVFQVSRIFYTGGSGIEKYGNLYLIRSKCTNLYILTSGMV